MEYSTLVNNSIIGIIMPIFVLICEVSAFLKRKGGKFFILYTLIAVINVMTFAASLWIKDFFFVAVCLAIGSGTGIIGAAIINRGMTRTNCFKEREIGSYAYELTDSVLTIAGGTIILIVPQTKWFKELILIDKELEFSNSVNAVCAVWGAVLIILNIFYLLWLIKEKTKRRL